MKKILSIISLAAITIGLLGSCKKEDPKVSVTGVTLEPTTLEITVGDDVKLTATVAPENATDKTVSWSSDKADVASVDNEGNVQAIAAGSATITVTTTDGGNTATCAVTVKAALPEGALAGKFTVNAEGKKVHFSKGNLYYDGNNFSFEEHQYCDPEERPDNHIGYFFWSKDESVATASTYSDPDHDASDFLFTNATADTPDPNFVVNGVRGTYRALSRSEFGYLLNQRPDAGNKVGFAKVCDKEGIILLPDDFTDPDKNNGSEPFCPKSTNNQWSANVYDNAGWGAMESAGAVFLPHTGYYHGGEYYADDEAVYWCSDLYANYQGNILYVTSNHSVSVNNISVNDGFTVRLVTYVPAE